ncbi:YggS family pyridoxal phosphate-dependent enzyme [Aestuariivirga sp.]|uniref:YggS family pyridoxal phosphate-dependent enzyme n=1 Tax=Aestuariivirga sp. TaxID=2650926 RepID=UPI0039E5BC1F
MRGKSSMGHAGLERVQAGVRHAAQAVGRDPSTVTLIAVSKTFGPTDIQPVINAGQRVFGENRVQEAKGKWPALRESHADLQLHLIGPLQSNKAAEAVALFDAIHTVDRPKIAEAIAREMERQGKRLQLFIQVNTGREPQKAGVAPDEADRFIGQCRSALGLSIAGLMCIPPADQDPVPHFSMLADIARRNGLEGLSLGMSGDYPQAIACGATHIRVGSAIFGGRG